MAKLVTKAQYNSNPRSKALRDITVKALRDVEMLLYEEPEDKQRYYAEIESLAGQLISMGIVRDMHTGKSQAFFRDPVNAAEYCAGQLLVSSGSHVVSEHDALPIIQEFSIHQSENTYLVPTADAPKPMIDFVVVQAVANTLLSFLDEV